MPWIRRSINEQWRWWEGFHTTLRERSDMREAARDSGKSQESESSGHGGKVGSVGKVNFHTNGHAWTFLRKYKGRKFSYGSKSSCGTPGIARRTKFCSPKRVSLAIKVLRTLSVERVILTHGGEMGGERGRVWFKKVAHGVARGYHLPPHKQQVH